MTLVTGDLVLGTIGALGIALYQTLRCSPHDGIIEPVGIVAFFHIREAQFRLITGLTLGVVQDLCHFRSGDGGIGTEGSDSIALHVAIGHGEVDGIVVPLVQIHIGEFLCFTHCLCQNLIHTGNGLFQFLYGCGSGDRLSEHLCRSRQIGLFLVGSRRSPFTESLVQGQQSIRLSGIQVGFGLMLFRILLGLLSFLLGLLGSLLVLLGLLSQALGLFLGLLGLLLGLSSGGSAVSSGSCSIGSSGGRFCGFPGRTCGGSGRSSGLGVGLCGSGGGSISGLLCGLPR